MEDVLIRGRPRPDKDLTWLRAAWELAEQGTCCKKGVGCFILDVNGRVVGSGWNGTEEGEDHCCKDLLNENGKCVVCIHAEDNALHQAGLTAARGGTLYITHQPCFNCSRLIVRSGIARVVYDVPHKNRAGIDKLIKRGIKVDRRPIRSVA